ncbi:2-acylglycerol O-acyltransferase 2-B-like isoform X2 [Sphaerodactylus townsendi]|uniref:2-acylglycerol O-acyltransferase 2-B-like isoform X2 n=1 Tax=Sphaerodactylus townsendi TaxID=933632 RepID=UPI002026CF2B|nr:2-acylglycerol O-acyltransferase 2-B-like isoform X2 [Sphaerodactylus townsendi]
MWLRFAPLRLPLRRRLQTAAVLQWVFSFLALAQCCLGLFVLLLLGEGWALAVLYAAWLYLDWETPARGGRRSAWVRRWAVWRHFRDYFPITLVKVADLDPARNYLFGFHPHGVLVAGAFGNFCTEATGFQELFPGLTPHLLMLPFWFKVPFFRDYIMSGEPPWSPSSPLGRTSSSIRFPTQRAPSSALRRSGCRRPWGWRCPSSTPEGCSSTASAFCLSGGPSILWWGPQSLCPRLPARLRKPLTSCTRPTWRNSSSCLKTTRSSLECLKTNIST